jgi:hypothetical protein
MNVKVTRTKIQILAYQSNIKKAHQVKDLRTELPNILAGIECPTCLPYALGCAPMQMHQITLLN